MKRLNKFYSSFREEWEFLKNIKVEKYTLFITLIFILSLLDASFTLTWIKSGLAVEANPLLKSLMLHGDFPFIGTKVALTGLGCGFLFFTKDESKFAKATIIFLLGTYVLLTLYHFLGALQSLNHNVLPDFVDDILLWLS